LFADFDTSVKRIIAQPFLLSAQVEGAVKGQLHAGMDKRRGGAAQLAI
jgi:hypothetical protein